jgi:hypothetical protein
MYRAEALEVRERGWQEREQIRGVCGYAARGEVVDLRLRLAAKSGSSLVPDQRPQTFFLEME